MLTMETPRLSIPGRRALCSLAIVLSMLVLTGAAAAADDFIKRANALYSNIKPEVSADRVLFPLLAKMDAPPAALIDAKRAAMLQPGMTDWPAVQAWVDAAPQREVLAAVKKVTDEEAWKKAYAISLPYGADAAAEIDPNLVITKMYVEVGEPAILAQSDFLYMKRFAWIELLIQAEATRLVEAGKPADAMDQLVRLCWIARMMADREFLQEKSWGLDALTLALMRIRDIAYVDSRKDTHVLTAEQLRDVIKRLKRSGGMLGLDRLTSPQANLIAAEQLVAQVMVPSAGPDPERWSRFLARIISKDRPIRMFSEQAKWDSLRTIHANTNDTAQRVRGVFADFDARWKLDPFDPRLKTPSDYARLDRARFALVDSMVADLDTLLPQRTVVKVEAAGTRMALAAYAFQLAQRNIPPTLAACRPSIIPEVDLDTTDPNKKRFVNYLTSSNGKAFPIVVFPEILGVRTPQFELSIPGDRFILSVVGPDGILNNNFRYTQTMADDRGDYLLWPPVLSLVRQNLVERGSLK